VQGSWGRPARVALCGRYVCDEAAPRIPTTVERPFAFGDGLLAELMSFGRVSGQELILAPTSVNEGITNRTRRVATWSWWTLHKFERPAAPGIFPH
jgi:hypothetical protein